MKTMNGDDNEILVVLSDIRDSVARLPAIESRLESMDGRLQSMDGRLQSMDGRLQSMDGRLGSVEVKMDALIGVVTKSMAPKKPK